MKTPWLALLGLVAAAAAQAQSPQGDPRWEAWLGCWSAQSGAIQSPSGNAPTVCVIPATGGVDVVTVVDTSIVSRDHVEAIAARHAVTREACTGWETDTWAREGDRLYRRSEYTCPGDVKRTTSEVFAISPDWEWLDVQGLSSHGDMGVRSLRYRTAAVPAVPEITAALVWHAAVSISRAAAAAPPTPEAVIEASRLADPAVVEAWVAEEGEGFQLNGKQVLALADSGVPSRVIDIMVAMSYPKAFTVAAPSALGGFNGAQASRRPSAPDTSYAYRHGLDDLYAPPYPWGWDYYSPWSWSLYGYYSPFFYSPYGEFTPYYGGYYGSYYGGLGGYYYGGGSVIVLTTTPTQPHGRIVNRKGYDYGQSGGTASSQPASGSYQGSSGSYSSGSTTSSSAPPPPPSSPPPSSGSSGSQAGQHAKPKP